LLLSSQPCPLLPWGKYLVLQNSYVDILTSKMIVIGEGSLGWLGLEGGVSKSWIDAFIKGTQQTSLALGGPHQILICQHFDLGLSSLHNCEKEIFGLL
jgi:hypothetical protein